MKIVKKGSSARDALKAQLEGRKTVERAEAEGRIGPGVSGREHMVLCLDLSGSMFNQMDWLDRNSPLRHVVLKDAANGLLAKSTASTVAIVTYGTQAGLHRDWAPGPEHVGSLRDLYSLGMTRGVHALELASSLLSDKAGVRRVVFMSDGCDEDRDGCLQCAEQLAAQGIVVDTVAFGADADRDLLRAMAKGGTMVEGTDAHTLKKQFLQLEARTRGLLGSGR